MKYSEKLKDPRWQKKRLEIFERDEFSCRQCCDDKSTICVHHLRYISGIEPWEYPDHLLITLCEDCHNVEYECMKKSADSLIEQIKDQGFLSGSVETLAYAFNGLRMILPPEVMVDIIAFSFKDLSTIKEMERRYFEHIKEKNKFLKYPKEIPDTK